MKPSLKLRRKHAVVLVACTTVGLGAFIGASYAAQSESTPSTPNTAGTSGHPRALHASAAPIAVAALPGPAQAALGSIGSKAAAPLATVGAGAHATTVFAVRGADGATCIEVTHAGGNIAEPANCVSDAYLRVWNSASGTGDPGTGTIVSKRIVAVVSAEVSTVRVLFADGSSRDFSPDANGIVTLETTSGQTMATAVEAIASTGATLASLNV